jgi:hypothetical protein
MRNLSFPQLLHIAKVLHRRAEPPLQSRHATNMSSPASHAMVPIISVSPQSLSLAHSFSLLYLAKCVHRKTCYSYVKFHRQTAPLGPGHSPSLSRHFQLGPAISSHPSIPIYTVSQIHHSFSWTPCQCYFPPCCQSSLRKPSVHLSPASASLCTIRQCSVLFCPLPSSGGTSFPDRCDPIGPCSSTPGHISRYAGSHDHSTVARYAQSYNLRGDPQDYPVPPSPIGVDYGHKY